VRTQGGWHRCPVCRIPEGPRDQQESDRRWSSVSGPWIEGPPVVHA